MEKEADFQGFLLWQPLAPQGSFPSQKFVPLQGLLAGRRRAGLFHLVPDGLSAACLTLPPGDA